MSDKYFKKIRIFVASPDDVKSERQQIKSIVKKLNQKGNIADSFGLVLEILDLSDSVMPGMGRPESIIINQILNQDIDLFIGILWTRIDK